MSKMESQAGSNSVTSFETFSDYLIKEFSTKIELNLASVPNPSADEDKAVPLKEDGARRQEIPGRPCSRVLASPSERDEGELPKKQIRAIGSEQKLRRDRLVMMKS